MSYVCSCCGKTHDGLPDVAFDRPQYARAVPDHDQESRVTLDHDFCAVDDEYYFIRGVIEIPIRDDDGTFGIGVWVSQKRENYQAYADNFRSSEIGPFFGWLSNDFLFDDESATHLKTMVHFRGGDLRPLVVLESTGHPLAVAQRNGILIDDAWAFIHQYWDEPNQ